MTICEECDSLRIRLAQAEAAVERERKLAIERHIWSIRSAYDAMVDLRDNIRGHQRALGRVQREAKSLRVERDKLQTCIDELEEALRGILTALDARPAAAEYAATTGDYSCVTETDDAWIAAVEHARSVIYPPEAVARKICD